MVVHNSESSLCRGKKLEGDSLPFFATGVSSVIHPVSNVQLAQLSILLCLFYEMCGFVITTSLPPDQQNR